MYNLWKVISDVYRWSHEHFDVDVDVCVMLTNEHIRNHDLSEFDAEFYRQLAAYRKEVAETRKRKREEAAKRYRNNRRRMLRL
jgi:hypothetical protein